MSDHTPGGLGVDGAATAPGLSTSEASHGTAAPEAAQQARYSEGHLATAPFEARVQEALADARLQGAMRAGTERLSGAYGDVAAATPDFAILRRRAAEIRAETLRGLDRHLDTLATNVERNGGHVYFARDAAAACSYVLEVARRHGARRAVKSKSMISEEIGLNHVLQAAGVETLETDLGEYIVQQAGEMPAHIVIPALHKTVDQVAGLFGAVLGHDLPPEPPRLTAAVRAVLREAFLTADMGITGVMKIAHACEGFGLDVQLHAPGPAQRACMAAIRNTNYYELGLVHPKVPAVRSVYQDYSDALDAVDARGHVPVPQGPGLGAAIDWDYVRHHQTGHVVYE
ncbi:MAG: hypothetical protein NVSMB65_08760 [Chloroflexota bacterium]